MYPSNDPTQGAIYRHNDHRRAWLAVAGGVVAVLVVAFLIVAACSGRDSQTGTPLGAGAGSPATSGVGSSGGGQSGGEQTGGEQDSGDQGGGDQGGDPGDGDQGGGDGGDDQGGDPGDGGDDGDDGQPEDPGPLSIDVSVNGPPPAIGCSAKGRINVTGGEYPSEVTYQWHRMQALPPHNILVPLPFGEAQTVEVTEPGEVTVTSPQFPEDAPDNRVMLVVTSEAGGSSGWVTYPKCTKLVLRLP